MALYENAQTRVRCGNGYSEGFYVRVGLHQGSVLSPLLFATVMDVLTESVKKDVLWNLLYADDLVLISESMHQLERDFTEWKIALESKGLRVNMGKTKVLEACGGGIAVEESKEDPCGVCGKRVMRNSCICTTCQKWIHAKCAGVKKITNRMAENFVCKKCRDIRNGSRNEQEQLYMGEVDKVDRFCYLGDTINSGGGCEIAVARRCRLGWVKFNELASILTSRRFTMRSKGRIYEACVRTAMVYGSETWNVKIVEEGILRRTERSMIRKMCGFKLSDRKNTIELMERLGLKETIVEVVKKCGLR